MQHFSHTHTHTRTEAQALCVLHNQNLKEFKHSRFKMLGLLEKEMHSFKCVFFGVLSS